MLWCVTETGTTDDKYGHLAPFKQKLVLGFCKIAEALREVMKAPYALDLGWFAYSSP